MTLIYIPALMLYGFIGYLLVVDGINRRRTNRRIKDALERLED